MRNPLRSGDWPLATQLVLLCVGITAILALGLTALGYLYANHGLRQEADAALASDGLLAVDAVDNWNRERLSDLRALAAVPAVHRVAELGVDGAAPEDVRTTQELLETMAAHSEGVDSIGIVDRDGTIVLSSSPDSLGTRVAQRDFFQQALAGNLFITGATVSNLTRTPTIFYAAPIRGAGDQVVGVIRSRSSLAVVDRVVDDARDRVGPGALGILVDANGLVIASSLDASWKLRPLVALRP